MEDLAQQVQRLSAFADGNAGGNPAGVWLGQGELPDAGTMQSVAAKIGFSETVFAALQPDGQWRARYFAPAMEVPFCGHATIALGAALAQTYGSAKYDLVLNQAEIWVEGASENGVLSATLQSPPTRSRLAEHDVIGQVLELFGWCPSDLHPVLKPSLAHAGADFFVLPLHNREVLSSMTYDFEIGKKLMEAHGWVTIALVVPESDQSFHVRNAFAVGGVVEDPATGAAAAAFAGMLRDQGWPHGGSFLISQGVDMGIPSKLKVDLSDQIGSGVRVSGEVRVI